MRQRAGRGRKGRGQDGGGKEEEKWKNREEKRKEGKGVGAEVKGCRGRRNTVSLQSGLGSGSYEPQENIFLNFLCSQALKAGRRLF